MSMSLDGYVADANDGVAEVFDWYFSGDVEVSTASTTSGMTFHVSAPSADHLRSLEAEGQSKGVFVLPSSLIPRWSRLVRVDSSG
jgi:hypothetical protein